MLTKLEILEDKARQNDIRIYNYRLSPSKKACCVEFGDEYVIALDKYAITSRAEECVLLAEEIGHIETGGLFVPTSSMNSMLAKLNRSKQEAGAKHWAYNECCSVEDIEVAFSKEGMYGSGAAAEYLGVTVDFLENAINYHRSYGVSFYFDDWGDCAW